MFAGVPRKMGEKDLLKVDILARGLSIGYRGLE